TKIKVWVGLTTRKTPLFGPPNSPHSGDTPAMLRRHSAGTPGQGRKQLGRRETFNAPLVRWAGPDGRRWRLPFLRQRRTCGDRESESPGGVR
ncbi:hypothetical protein VIGAN_06087000, partial [Vigna angularis var. angularis]